MRLREIRFIINESLENLKLQVTQKGKSADQRYNINSLNNMREYKLSIQKLKKLDIFKQEIAVIEKHIIYSEMSDTVYGKEQDIKVFISYTNALIKNCTNMILLIDNAIEKQQEDGISIKLPQTEDLESISKYLKTISLLSSKILHNNIIKGEIKLLNFDTGTLWIDIALGSYIAYRLIASIAWTATVIKNKKLDIKIKEEEAKSLGLKNENLNNLVIANKELIELFIDHETKAINKEFFNNSSSIPDSQKRIKEALKDITELIEKGAEIHPSLVAPEKKKELFPNYNDKNLLTSFQKLIEKKIDT